MLLQIIPSQKHAGPRNVTESMDDTRFTRRNMAKNQFTGSVGQTDPYNGMRFLRVGMSNQVKPRQIVLNICCHTHVTGGCLST